jgi:hypothetical protein
MRNTQPTKRDKELMALRDHIFKVCKTPLAYKKLKEYIDEYYKPNVYRDK